MNVRQLELWNNLMKLTASTETFYFVDQKVDEVFYRIFSYRLASYTDFLNPDALECRGHMFEISGEGDAATPVRLAAWPQEKFFNASENTMTMNLDFSYISSIMVKADGSLISTYSHNGDLRLKSKTSLVSTQAVDAMDWLNLPENAKFKQELSELANKDYTVNMEWVSKDNRIVLGYLNPELIVLNVRDNENGQYVKGPIRHVRQNGEEMLLSSYNEICNRWVEYVFPANTEQFIKDIPNMIGIEGFVIQLPSGQHVKIKTIWYVSLHHTKDSVNNPCRLFEAVVDEASDDLKTMFVDDPLALKLINEMEVKVDKIYNHMVSTVEKFYADNKHLERKDYAILGQRVLDKLYFGLAMNSYTGKTTDYKEFMKKNFKLFDIKDENLNKE